MIDQIEQWIDQTNAAFEEQRTCCACFTQTFDGFYPPSFLQHAFYVVVDRIPKPDFPELRQMGMGSLIDMDLSGITYKNIYYLRPEASSIVRLHFHELVHVAQWKVLGAKNFIERYIGELLSNGYHQAPLEMMAYALDSHYANGGAKTDIPSFVEKKI